MAMAFSSSWTSSTAVIKQGSGSSSTTSSILGRKRKMPEISLAVVGRADAGKGDLLHSFTRGRYRAAERPTHVRLVSVTLHDGAAVRVFDTPGNLGSGDGKRLGGGRPVATGLVAVYSVQDRTSLDEAVRTLSSHMEDRENRPSGTDLQGAVLMGTWTGTRPFKRTVTYKQGMDRAKALGATFHEFGCNNSRDLDVQNLFYSLAEQCLVSWQRTCAEQLKKRKENNNFVKASYIKKVFRLVRKKHTSVTNSAN